MCFRIILVLVVTIGCAHQPQRDLLAQSADPSSEPEYLQETRQIEFCRQQSPVASYRRTSNLSEKLWQYFEKMNWPKTKKGGAEVRRFYDIGCGISGASTQIVKCYYQITPNGKSVENSKPQDVLAELRSLLFEYPIANGESGAQASYISCEKYKGNPASCDISINIDYPGP